MSTSTPAQDKVGRGMAIQWSSRDMPEPLLAYVRLPLQFGLFYWAWALAKDIKIKSDAVMRGHKNMVQEQ